MISLVQVMIAAMTLITIPNVEKDLGTVIQIVNVKKALNVGRIIVMIMELSLVQVMTAASSLVKHVLCKTQFIMETLRDILTLT